jgi:hypothetical protein
MIIYDSVQQHFGTFNQFGDNTPPVRKLAEQQHQLYF